MCCDRWGRWACSCASWPWPSSWSVGPRRHRRARLHADHPRHFLLDLLPTVRHGRDRRLCLAGSTRTPSTGPVSFPCRASRFPRRDRGRRQQLPGEAAVPRFPSRPGRAAIHELFRSSPGALRDARVGEGTRIWAFAHVLPGARIGRDCNICDHVFIENDVVLGDRVTVKCGVQLWDGLARGRQRVHRPQRHLHQRQVPAQQALPGARPADDRRQRRLDRRQRDDPARPEDRQPGDGGRGQRGDARRAAQGHRHGQSRPESAATSMPSAAKPRPAPAPSRSRPRPSCPPRWPA